MPLFRLACICRAAVGVVFENAAYVFTPTANGGTALTQA